MGNKTRNINHFTKVELKQFNTVGSFQVETKHERAVYHQQSARTNKANKIARCMDITENMHETFAKVVRAANRSEATKERNAAKYAARRK